jgi:RNase P/RNase MRP subunit p29
LVEPSYLNEIDYPIWWNEISDEAIGDYVVVAPRATCKARSMTDHLIKGIAFREIKNGNKVVIINNEKIKGSEIIKRPEDRIKK